MLYPKNKNGHGHRSTRTHKHVPVTFMGDSIENDFEDPSALKYVHLSTCSNKELAGHFKASIGLVISNVPPAFQYYYDTLFDEVGKRLETSDANRVINRVLWFFWTIETFILLGVFAKNVVELITGVFK